MINLRDTTHNNNNGLLDSGISSIRYGGITGSIPLFDGSSNDQMKITCSAAITGIKSISFWIKPKSVSQKTLLYLKDDSTDTFIEINGSAQINTSNVSSPTTYVNTSTTTTTLVVDKWYHIVITTGTGITTDTSIYVSSKVSSDYYNGFIDDIRFYNIELTSQQINNLYYQQSTPQLPHNNELIGKWLLNGNFLDSSVYQNHGTLTGNEQFITGYNGNLAYKSNANNSTINLGSINNVKSISMWLYFEKLDNTFLNLGYNISLSSSGNINLSKAISVSPNLYLNGIKDSLSGYNSESTLELDKWNNVIITSNSDFNFNSISRSTSNIDYTKYILLPTLSVSAWQSIPPSGGTGWSFGEDTDQDDSVELIELNTPFKFYNTDYTDFYLSTNGWIRFGESSAPNSDTSETVAEFENRKIICFLWQDLNPSAGGDIYYKYKSTTNTNDTFVIAFVQVHEFGTNYDNSVEIRLHLNNSATADIGKIELEYGVTKNTTDGIIGISNGAGGDTNSLEDTDMYSNSSNLTLDANQSIYNEDNVPSFEGKLITFIPYRDVISNDNLNIILSHNFLNGTIQNVEFYNTQLTDGQVKDIYKYGTHNDLVLHYKFDEGSGNTALDNSRNNYDGTIVSATYTSNYLGELNKALSFDGSNDYVINSDIVKSGDTDFLVIQNSLYLYGLMLIMI